MDELDHRLLSALRRNGRASVSELASTLGTTRATVRARLEKLQKSGEVLGFTVILRGDLEDMPVRGMTMIEIEGKGTNRIISILNGYPEVQAIHTTNGRWDLMVELGADSLAELDNVLNKIRLVDGIQNSETNLWLTTIRRTR
ncbi:MAG TPA: Lrp/AsnC family transcriptional regulator [Hyphomicrobiales bacterium]|nr:Lrp/AsnC family transcriptional regulator [Hyphomicrobiales bacterium]